MSGEQPLPTDKEDLLGDEQRRCEAAQTGDRQALGELLTLHGPRLYRQVLLPRLGRASAAEEALAVTYLEVIKSFGNFRWQGIGVYPWLRLVALRVALRAIRKGAGETLCEPSDLARELEETAIESSRLSDNYDLAKTRGYVERALEQLSTQHAETLRLRFLEERTREELAELWRLTPNAVDQRVHRAKQALRAGLQAAREVKSASPLVFLLVDGGAGATVHVFNRAQVSLGRAPDSDLKLPGEGVSRQHAVLSVDAASSSYWITDLGSSNGTLLRGQPVTGRVRMSMGDSLRVGGYVISIAATPLLSLWARALLAEEGGEGPGSSDAEAPPVSQGASAPTERLSQVLQRRTSQVPADSGCSSAAEERIEALLRLAWQSEELDQTFNERAVEAVLLAQE
jgi:RNA polymerase sigma factor (sigma-70 family)